MILEPGMRFKYANDIPNTELRGKIIVLHHYSRNGNGWWYYFEESGPDSMDPVNEEDLQAYIRHRQLSPLTKKLDTVE